jgi:hypothetical protein
MPYIIISAAFLTLIAQPRTGIISRTQLWLKEINQDKELSEAFRERGP